MRFLFVDRITECVGDTVKGVKHFSVDAPLQYTDLNGVSEIAPGAISEAIGQLASWLALKQNDFVARPIFLFADRIAIGGAVRPGATVELRATLEPSEGHGNDKTFVFSGEASVDGRGVHAIERCNGYFMPLAELENPETTRRRFADLTSGGLKLTGDHGTFSFDSLVGETITIDPGEKIVTSTVLSPSQPFYADHFPRFPVTPIVMINEMIGRTAGRMLSPTRANALRALAVESIKIRNFVKPGDTVETRISVLERQAIADRGERIVTLAEVVKDGRLILRGRYTYSL